MFFGEGCDALVSVGRPPVPMLLVLGDCVGQGAIDSAQVFGGWPICAIVGVELPALCHDGGGLDMLCIGDD